MFALYLLQVYISVYLEILFLGGGRVVDTCAKDKNLLKIENISINYDMFHNNIINM